MNELIEHKSWWKRNWKWLTTLFALFLFLMITIAYSPVGTRISDITQAYADPILLENAILKAQENEDVVELLGSLEKVKGIDIMRGIVNYSNNHKTIDLYFHVKGSKGTGRMRVFADYHNDKWIYNNISIISKNDKEPIVVIENLQE